MLKIGRKAPAFSLLNQDAETETLKNVLGKWIVLYFYPKDDTPGCTKEACAIADVYKDFKRQGVVVFGVSKDTPKSHKKCAEKYSLPFTLLSDPTMEMMTKYGAFAEKKMSGKVVRGTNRITYIINPEGKIVQAYAEVDPASHALLLLSDLKRLKNEYKAATAA
jgi:peroxiredoxin Q/BCP